MSRRNNTLLIQDIFEAAVKIRLYTKGMGLEEFKADEKTIDAVIRNFEIIGEAANRLDVEFKLSNPEIEWDRMRGFRNRIIHEYFGIDLEIVWPIIVNDIASLIKLLEEKLK